MKIENAQITFNDEFDKENYPIEDWHRKAIIDLMNQLQLPFSTVWFYQATIHGRIFWFIDERKRFARLNGDTIKALSQMNGFRWVESGNGSFALALEHQAPPITPSDNQNNNKE